MKQEFWHTTTLHIKLVALVSSLFHKKVQMRDLKHPDIGIFGSCGIKWNENSDMTLHHIIILSIYTYRTKHKVYKWNGACFASEIPSCHSCGFYYSKQNMRPNFYNIKMAISARMALTRWVRRKIEFELAENAQKTLHKNQPRHINLHWSSINLSP